MITTGAAGGGRLVPVTQRDGRRASTAVAYLRPALVSGNIDALTETHVCHVQLEGERAVGVEVLRGGDLTRSARIAK